MKETRQVEWFHKTMEVLARRQNECRDDVLDSLLTHKYDDAKSRLETLQQISVGIQLCQQTIARENDRIANEARKAAEEDAAKVAQPAEEPKLKVAKGKKE